MNIAQLTVKGSTELDAHQVDLLTLSHIELYNYVLSRKSHSVYAQSIHYAMQSPNNLLLTNSAAQTPQTPVKAIYIFQPWTNLLHLISFFLPHSLQSSTSLVFSFYRPLSPQCPRNSDSELSSLLGLRSIQPALHQCGEELVDI